jgi:hypothetical protein
MLQKTKTEKHILASSCPNGHTMVKDLELSENAIKQFKEHRKPFLTISLSWLNLSQPVICSKLLVPISAGA